MRRRHFATLLILVPVLALSSFAQSHELSSENLTAMNVSIKNTNWKGKDAVQLLETGEGESVAIVKGVDFRDGTIELEVAGMPAKSAIEAARGFIGVAFRFQRDIPSRYDAFYIRPTNGRADDQVRRNHSTQYISHPLYTWYKLRKEFPDRYESYVDLVPGEWTKLKVVVKGERAELYVHDAPQPCLVVNDLKGPKEGGIALWIGIGTEAYFRNLEITAAN